MSDQEQTTEELGEHRQRTRSRDRRRSRDSRSKSRGSSISSKGTSRASSPVAEMHDRQEMKGVLPLLKAVANQTHQLYKGDAEGIREADRILKQRAGPRHLVQAVREERAMFTECLQAMLDPQEEDFHQQPKFKIIKKNHLAKTLT